MDVKIYQILSSIFEENHTFFPFIYFISLFFSTLIYFSVAENRKGFNMGNELLINQWRVGGTGSLGITLRTILQNWPTRRPAPSSTVRKSCSHLLAPGAHHLNVIWKQTVATRILSPRNTPSYLSLLYQETDTWTVSSRVSSCLLQWPQQNLCLKYHLFPHYGLKSSFPQAHLFGKT